MHAVWLERQRLPIREVAKPEPSAGQALVRVLFAGICNTDIELTKGYSPYTGIPGHEFVGVGGKRSAGTDSVDPACPRSHAASAPAEETRSVASVFSSFWISFAVAAHDAAGYSTGVEHHPQANGTPKHGSRGGRSLPGTGSLDASRLVAWSR